MKEIDNILNKFFENQGFEIEAEEGNDFSYWYADSKIIYTLKKDKGDQLFLDFALQNGLNFDCGYFILSIFHEIGHDETIDELTKQEERECAKLKKRLGTSDDDYITYFNVLDEYYATEWAIDFINENSKAIKQLQKALSKYIG